MLVGKKSFFLALTAFGLMPSCYGSSAEIFSTRNQTLSPGRSNAQVVPLSQRFVRTCVEDHNKHSRKKYLNKQELILLSHQSETFFFYNPKTSRIEKRDCYTGEEMELSVPIDLPEGKKFCGFESAGSDDFLFYTAGISLSKNGYYEVESFVLNWNESISTSIGDFFPELDKTKFNFYIGGRSNKKNTIIVKRHCKEDNETHIVSLDLVAKEKKILAIFDCLISNIDGFVFSPQENSCDLPSVLYACASEDKSQTVYKFIKVSEHSPHYKKEPFYGISSGEFLIKDIEWVDYRTGEVYLRRRDDPKGVWTPYVYKKTFSDKGHIQETMRPLLLEAPNVNIRNFFHSSFLKEPKLPSMYSILEEGIHTVYSASQQNLSHALGLEPFSELDLISISSHDLSEREGRLCLLSTHPQKGQSYEFFEYEVKEGELPSLTHKNKFDPFTDHVGKQESVKDKLSDPEFITVPTEEGLEVNASFFSPCTMKGENVNQAKIPLFVHLHGGPHAKTKFTAFHPIAQYVQSYGYGVLDINYPGSTDQSLSFEKWSDGNFDKISSHIIKAVDWVVENRRVDKTKMAVGGISFGATLSINLIARFPEYFKVALPINGFYDYKQAIIDSIEGKGAWDGLYFSGIQQMGGDPREDEAIANKSAYPHLDKIENDCKIVLVAGLKDKTCFPHHSIELAKSLKEKGKNVELYTIEEVGHSLEFIKPKPALETKTEEPSTVTTSELAKEGYDADAWGFVAAMTTKVLGEKFSSPSDSFDALQEKMKPRIHQPLLDGVE